MAAVDKRMRNTPPGEPQPYLSDALVTLVGLESDILSRAKGEDVPLDTRVAKNLLGPLLSYATGKEAPVDTNLTSVMVWTYTENKAGQKTWPPAWLSATTTNAAGILTNVVIASGLDAFIRQATNTMQDVSTNWVQVTGVASSLRGFNAAEDAFLAGLPDTSVMMKSFGHLATEEASLEHSITNAAGNGLFNGGISFNNAFQTYTNKITMYAVGAFDRVEKENLSAIRKQGDYPVFMMISRRLQAERRSFSSSLANLVSPAEMAEFKTLDAKSLALKDGQPAWKLRWRMYEGVASLARLSGFPLLRTSARMMTPDDMNKADAVLQALLTDANSGAIQELQLKNAGSWTTFTNRLTNLKRLADMLRVKDRPDFCTISLLKMDDQNRADDVWRAKYRYIKLAGNSTKMEKTNIGEDTELGKVNVTQGCSFQLFQRDSDQQPGETVAEQGEWGPLALIAKYDSRPAQEGDYTTWIVKRPVSGGSGDLRIRLKFDEPLVNLEHWPKE